MKRRVLSTVAGRAILSSVVLMLVLAACGNGGGAGGKDRKLRAGMNDPNDKNIALMVFLPAESTVEVGAKVTWSFPGPEPHTVTFVPPGAKQPLPSDPDATKVFPATGSYDGTTKVSSGLIGFPNPADFSLTFSKAGSYTYYCAVHPRMIGKLKVVAAGAKVESARDARKRANGERDKYLAEGRGAKQRYIGTPPKQTKNSDGSTTWTVEMGVSTEHTDVFAFQPVPANIKKGDRVVFVNNSAAPHTASFAGTKTMPQDPESAEAKNATGKSPLTLNATDFFNTGWLPPNAPPGQGPPLVARSFAFEVPAAGTYAYVCILHVGSGHSGSVVAS